MSCSDTWATPTCDASHGLPPLLTAWHAPQGSTQDKRPVAPEGRPLPLVFLLKLGQGEIKVFLDLSQTSPSSPYSPAQPESQCRTPWGTAHQHPTVAESLRGAVLSILIILMPLMFLILHGL